MENDKKDEVIVDLEEESNEEGKEEAKETPKKEEKPKRTPEEELEYFESRAKRLRKKLGKDEKDEKPSKPKDVENISYDKLAYLESKQIHEDNHDWVLETAEEMSVSLTEFLKKDWVKNELKERDEKRKTKEATPKSNKRGTSQTGDEKETAFHRYVNDGVLPEDREMREYVVERRMKQDSHVKPFYNS